MRSLLVILLVLIAVPAFAMSEADYVSAWCTDGVVEYRLPDKTRIDCLTDDHAIEFDWASNKIYEAIGQSLHYAMQTGRRAGVVLIEKGDSSQKYVDRFKKIILHYNLPIDLVDVIERDEE